MNTLKCVCIVSLGVAGAASKAQEIVDVDEIVVTAGAEKVASETPQSLSVVNQDDLNVQQPVTVGDAVGDLPGVSTIGSERVLGEGFNIRGFGSDLAGGENRLIIQIDGATKYYQQYRMGSLFTDPEFFKRVEVLRGPASSTLFGSGALAGVISLETKDASDYLQEGDDFALQQKLSYSSDGEGYLTSTAVAFQPTENFELLGILNYRDYGDIEDGNGDVVEGTAFNAPSALIKGRLRFGEDDAQSLFTSYVLWTVSEPDSVYDQTGELGVFGTVDREVTDQTVTLGYTYAPPANDLIDLEVLYAYTDSTVEQENASAPIPSVIFQDSEYYYRTHQFTVENTSAFSTTLLPEAYVTYGLSASQQTRFAEAETGGVGIQPGGTDTKLAAYVQGELSFANGLTVIPGLRLENSTLSPDDLNGVFDTSDEVSNLAISPKLAALYEVNDNWNVFGSIAYSERLPTLDEVFDSGSGNVGGSGNLDLDPEQSLNFEIGASYTSYDVLTEGDGVTIKATLFRNEVENLIERQTQADPFENVGEALIQGLEIEGAYQADRFYGRLGYALIRGENLTDDVPLGSVPADQLTLTLGTRIPDYNLDIGWQGLFSARQDRVDDPADETPGYAVHDIYATWKTDGIGLADGEVRFRVNNVFDRFYQDHLSSTRASGRNVSLALAKTF